MGSIEESLHERLPQPVRHPSSPPSIPESTMCLFVRWPGTLHIDIRSGSISLGSNRSVAFVVQQRGSEVSASIFDSAPAQLLSVDIATYALVAVPRRAPNASPIKPAQ